ncbi:hypothetical protein LMG18091_02212 [Ralstonia wenshanensis]|uniref:Uncharacterized protein n=1 Tax=Ralstonia wenshanensis TaxID=2842456 RepID=A0AAD2ER21_9RALS|nr:hypothetical protein LMG18091_02212 [Ralstonia wenshanensis]
MQESIHEVYRGFAILLALTGEDDSFKVSVDITSVGPIYSGLAAWTEVRRCPMQEAVLVTLSLAKSVVDRSYQPH